VLCCGDLDRSNLNTLTDATDNPMSGEFRKVECADHRLSDEPLTMNRGNPNNLLSPALSSGGGEGEDRAA
jgi:hypothetical protein